MDFEEDIRQQILANMPHETKDLPMLSSKPVDVLLIMYRNWLDRFISARPRRVHRSTALLSNPLASDTRYKPALDQIVAFLSVGTDITPHLSRGVKYAYQTLDSIRTNEPRKDLDLLLSDWGIHHLHLSTVIEPDGFTARAGPLLFAAFRPNDAYLIDILTHHDWVNQHLVRTIVREWPDADLVHELANILPGNPVSERQRKILRKKHANALVEVDGKTYMPVGGLMSSGTAIRHTIMAHKVLHAVRSFESKIRNEPTYVAKTLLEHGLVPPPNPELRFEFFDDGGYGIVERHTGMRFRLSS